MTGGVGNDVEAEAEDNFEGEGKLSLTKDDLSLGGKLVGRFSTHIELVNSAEELFEVCNKVFGFTLKLANSVQSSAAIKQIRLIPKAILTKVRELSSFAEDSEAESKWLHQSIFETLVHIFSEVRGSKYTPSGSSALLDLIEGLLSSKTHHTTYFHEFGKILVHLSASLAHKQEDLCSNSERVYNNLLKSLKDFSGFTENVLEHIEKPIKFTYLSYVAQESNDKAIILKIAKAFNQLVMNDREKSNWINFPYFVPFLSKLDEETFRTQIYPEIEFMMNRNGSLIPVIGSTVAALGFTFSPETTLALSQALFTEEYLVKDEVVVQSTRHYFSQLGSKLTSPESVKALVIDFLLKKFVETRNSSLTGAQRLAIICHIIVALSALRKREIVDQDLIKLVITSAIEFFYIQKDEGQLKDAFSDMLNLFKMVHNADFLNASLKKVISKATNIWHVNLLTSLMIQGTVGLNDSILTAAGQFRTMLNGENFKTVTTYSQILALVGFFTQASIYLHDQSHFQWLLTNENVINYLVTHRGFVNTLAFWSKNPSFQDVRNHLSAIELFLRTHYSESPLAYGDQQLRDTLCEYLINETYNFREHSIIDTIDRVCASSETFIGNFMKSLYTKIKQISSRPPAYNREENDKRVNVKIVQRVLLALKYSLKHKKTDLNQDEFIALVKLIAHPFISKSGKDLKTLIRQLEAIYDNGRLQAYFEEHQQVLIDYAIRERSGILSHDPILRAMAINIGVLLSSQKLLPYFINDLVKILNYKPLELVQKLERVFTEEFDRISFYDLMFYSEVSKDLLNVFSSRDIATIRKELSTASDEPGASPGASEVPLEEEKEEAAPTKAIDPSKLAAMMLKQKAADKKAGAAAKKPAAKSATPAKPAPQATKKAPAAAAKEEAHQPMDKEKRNKADRAQLISYMQEIQRIKGVQVEAALEIVKRANQNDIQLDMTLNHLLMPLIKLLNYPTSRFATNNCLQSLFESHPREPLFHVKGEVISALNAISHQRIYIKHMREFQAIFQHIENNTQVAHFDQGYIQMIMVMANFVLKDLSVHLSVKEQALAVVQTILESTNLVANIDLVIVTINMMKSSYNNDNLAQFIDLLFKRLCPEELALILQRTFEYEPVPRRILLEELLKYEGPLYCPVWFSTQLWILQFDEECGKIAHRLWNRFGMVLRSGAIDLAREGETSNVYHYLRSKNTNIFDNSIRGMVSAIEIFQNRYDLIVEDLIEFYNQEMAIIEQETAITVEGGADQIGSKGIVADERLNRIAVAEIIKRTAHLVSFSSFKKVFDFFITQGCLDQIEQVSKACMDAALEVIRVKGVDYAEDLLKILERYLHDKTKSYSELSKNMAIIMIGALSNYLDNTSQKKLLTTFEKMLELLHTPSELIRQSVCKVIPQLGRFFEDKSKTFLSDHLRLLLKESQDDRAIRGSAYAVAGIVKGLGLQNFIALDVLGQIQRECFVKQADQMRKVSGLYLYETLSFSLGKVFEMQVEKILPDIMQCISDPKDVVRRAALQANRAIMSKLSNHAIKQVLPIFLQGLYQDNWRAKLASVEALGNTAFCAPRQIAGFLPQIVKGIREVLSDTHEKVHKAALQAIKNIGSVIKCPEIADILETLVKALSNPNVYLKDAMKVLLDTSFVHAIDAPSLSLLIPILDSGLMMHDNESKHLASKLMGNICNLTQDPEDLMPYIKILMPAIKNSLFDSIPEIRASAAKALGSLSKGLGLANSKDMIEWLHSVLNAKQLHSSERIGAAQGFAEIISVHGVANFEATIKFVVAKAQEPEVHIRESYRNVLVFLATSFDQFVKYLPKLLPIMIQGLSDDFEEVRKISLRNVKICIKFYGKQAPTQLVDPIMEMMFHRDFKVRQSSSVLMYQLVKELENDIIKLQPKYISNEVKNQILSSMFILKYDIIERVATQAAQIWKNIIDNQLKVLKSIINVLIKQNFDLILSDHMELQEMGLNCMRGIVEKFGEKFVSESVDILESYMERATDIGQTIAVAKAIYNMTFAAPIKLLTDLRNRFLTVIDGNICSENPEIRTLTAKTFITVLQKTFEPNYMTATIDKQFLKKLHNKLTAGQTNTQYLQLQSEMLILTLKEILRDQPPELKLEDKIIRLCNPAAPAPGMGASSIDSPSSTKLSIAQSKVLATVAAKIGANINKKKNCTAILEKLKNELTVDEIDDEKRVNEVLTTFSEVVSQSPEQDIVLINEQVISEFYSACKSRDRLAFYLDFIAYYCSHAKVNYEKFAKFYLENVLALMNDNDEKLVDKVVKSFTAIINGLQKENQFTLIPLIKDCIQRIAVDKCEHVGGGERSTNAYMSYLYKKKVQSIKMLEKAEGVKNLSAVIQNSITHSSQIEIRIDSAICFQYLIEFSRADAIKMEVIKICGALIRVVNDKFPAALKLQIFQALKLILIRVSLFAKAMAPQLQTTFLKAFNDSAASLTVRKTVVECLIHFLKIAPKVDPIVKELASMIEGDKVDDVAKAEVAEVLAIIIRLNGKVIQAQMATQIHTSLSNILKARPSPYLDKTQVNCAIALAFLSAYASESNQMFELFDSQDQTLNLNLSFGLKFGVLLNGAVPADKKPALLANLQEHLRDPGFKDLTGLEEIDGRFTKDAEEQEDEKGRLHGAFEILGHIGDTFVRRFPSDEIYRLQFKVVNQAGIFPRLNERNSVSSQTMYQVLNYLEWIPVKYSPDQQLDPELAQVVKGGLEFINQFYLEFQNKIDAKDAVLNLLQLNYDNYIDTNDDSKIIVLTEQKVKEVVNRECYKSLLAENVRMTVVELALI